MGPSKGSASNARLQRLTHDVTTRLRRRDLVGSRNVARETIVFFIAAIDIIADESSGWTSFGDFVAHIQQLGRTLQEAGPKELVIGNIVRRIVKFIKEEYNTAFTSSLEDGLPSATSNSSHNPNSREPNPLRPEVFAHAVTAAPPPIRQGSLPPTSQNSAQSSPSKRPPHASSSFSSATSAANIIPALHNKPSFHSGASSPNGSSLLSASSSGMTLTGHGTSMFDLLGHRSTMPSTLAVPAPPVDDQSDDAQDASANNGIKSPPGGNNRRSASPSPRPGSSLSQGEQLAEDEFSRNAHKMKRVFTEAVAELLDEVDSAQQDIAGQALEHIHAQEMILTLGHSSTVERFLKQAALKRKFTVIVAETAPSCSGVQHAKALRKAGIETILVPDSNVFALMSRVTKVVLGAHAVLADGSFFTTCGSLAACQVAKAHLVPVVVCTGLFKLCPIFLADDDSMLDEGNPLQVLDERTESTSSAALDEDSPGQVEVRNPFYDKVSSDLVSLFVTNAGGHPSSMCYRLLTDLFGT